jgi:hypothetical protein
VDARALYHVGADYVIMPHFLGAQYASQMVVTHGIDKTIFEGERARHIAYLNEKEKRGQDHPVAEKYR